MNEQLKRLLGGIIREGRDGTLNLHDELAGILEKFSSVPVGQLTPERIFATRKALIDFAQLQLKFDRKLIDTLGQVIEKIEHFDELYGDNAGG